MDRIAIGQFIAQCRKDKHLTQEQLAERLGITNKSVSKWENGSCLPDPSLYEPLCGILGISISELFTGKRKEEEQLSQMLTSKLYQASDKSVAFDAFHRALREISELIAVLRTFETKKEAVAFLAKETDESLETCSDAYDFYLGLFPETDAVRI